MIYEVGLRNKLSEDQFIALNVRQKQLKCELTNLNASFLSEYGILMEQAEVKSNFSLNLNALDLTFKAT